MREGWVAEQYLVLFDNEEISAKTEGYGIAERLPGYQLIGLRGWDDLILRDNYGQLFTVPAIPTLAAYLQPLVLPHDLTQLRSDARLRGLVKWYVMPLVFGGDPSAGPNMIWVTHDEHAQLVRWWNTKYDEAAAGT